ncbi:MAG: DUF2752 domain-containing protein [Butyrivibrio sp.]|nr:DUF2752 domain-containing protein [Butyrivibrio sp.]
MKTLLKDKDSDICLYVLGLFLLPFLVLCLFGAKHAGLIPGFCVFRALTGIYCPGCGGTRAFRLLFRGNIAKSFVYHPLVVYGTLLGAVFYISQTLRLISRGKIRGLHITAAYPIAGGALLLLNWIVKNMLLLIWRIQLIN